MRLYRGSSGRDSFYFVRESGKIRAFPPGTEIAEAIAEPGRADREIDSDFTVEPCVAPTKIVCVGRNYAEHARELGNEIPAEPLLFLKAPSALIGDGRSIVLPKQSERVEHEGELAVVIAKHAKALTDLDDVSEYIAGYTCLNDVTARDLQRRDIQFTRAKSFDTFCPVGPAIVTDIDVSDVGLQVRVDGQKRQAGRTSEMIFDIPFLLRYISNQMTLRPGDLVATGTPSGVSELKPGDLCEVEIEGIGTLRNPVVKSQ